MTDRYSKLNEHYAIDKEKGIKLSFDHMIEILNRTELLKKRYKNQNKAIRQILKEELKNAESPELKNSLNKILNKRL